MRVYFQESNPLQEYRNMLKIRRHPLDIPPSGYMCPIQINTIFIDLVSVINDDRGVERHWDNAKCLHGEYSRRVLTRYHRLLVSNGRIKVMP